MFKSPEFSRPAKPGLNFIQYQERAGVVTALAQGLKIPRLRYPYPRFPLYGFYNHCRGFPALDQLLSHGRGGASTTGAHRRDPHFFLVRVRELKMIFGLGAAADGAKVVTGLAEHFLGPVIRGRG